MRRGLYSVEQIIGILKQGIVSLDTCWVQRPRPAPPTEAKTECEAERGRLPPIPSRPHRAAAPRSTLTDRVGDPRGYRACLREELPGRSLH